ncbi:Lactam utilization protein LamB [Lunatimonas lonarensis]|uniref:Lactam utilization protein LamB n=1 Tax=Lunatimonas lonarensis TaxID=1232681 RepID=R7ZQL3_9BACT|nr:LamB/YcsF family protein [Lunatimonas lonarensis]EON76405.1 Lactam utilization protein LamB [Lunatimonas lonarensis]
MTSISIDINADLGEEVGNDAAIMPFVSSCSIACGGHAGNTESIRNAVFLALEQGIKIGAHPSYPDPTNFGRVKMEIASHKLHESIREQLMLLIDHLAPLGVPLHHVKPHGALYNEACINEDLAIQVVELIKEVVPFAKLYAPFASKLAQVGQESGVKVWFEGFVDRRYSTGLTLLERRQPGAVLHGWDEIRAQVEEMVLGNRVCTAQGDWHFIKVDTLCLHGDHPNAVQTAIQLREWLSGKNLFPHHE